MNPQMAFYMAQGISVITGILAIAMMQLKNMKMILMLQIIVNLTALTNYFLLGGGTGVIVSVLAIVQSVVMYTYNRRGAKPHMVVIVAFIIAYVLASAYNIYQSKNAMDLLPAFAAICFCISMVQRKPSMFRIWLAPNPMFWMGYDLYTKSYVMFCVHLGILISSVVGMIRLDGLFGRKGTNKE